MHSEIQIKEVEIKNFQSHENSRLDFHSGINMLTGSSNNGKSAVLRAIKWLITNEPSGTEFIRMNADTCVVSILFSNGNRVTRKKSRSSNINTYEIKRHNEDSVTQLTGFGSGVPKEVIEAIGINRPEFNFAEQLEAPYLISDSPKSRAQTIGNLEELSRIDRALVETNDDIRFNQRSAKKIESEIKDTTKEIEKAKERIKKQERVVNKCLKHKQIVVENLKIISVLEGYSKRILEIENSLSDLYNKIDSVDRVLKHYHLSDDVVNEVKNLSYFKTRIKEIEENIASEVFLDDVTVDALEEKVKENDSLIDELNVLMFYKNTLLEHQMTLNRITSQIKKKTSSLDLHPLQRNIDFYKELVAVKTKQRKNEETLAVEIGKTHQSQGNLEELINEMIELLHNQKQCPTCYQPTDSVKLDVNSII